MVCLFFQITFLYETFILSKTMAPKEVLYCYKSDMTQDMKRIKGSMVNHVSKTTVSKQEKHVLQMGHMDPCKEGLTEHLNIFSEVNLPSEILWTTSSF